MRTLRGFLYYGLQIVGYEIQQYHARKAKAYAVTHRRPAAVTTVRKVKR